jgi:uncharacterized membrane protein
MRSRIPSLVVVLLIAAYVLVFAAVGIRQHDAFLTHKEDLGQIDQAVWNSLHGRWLVETDEDHQSTRLTDHVEPSFILSSLVFLVWDDVRALLVWQALVLALGAWAIFLLARDVLGTASIPRSSLPVLPTVVSGQEGGPGGRPVPGLPAPWPASGRACGARSGGAPVAREREHRVKAWLAALFALIYLLFPALEAAHLAEFHAAPLAAAPIAFALLFLERRQWRRFVLAALLVVAVKEEMALVGAMLGVAGLVVALHDFRGPTGDPRRTADRRRALRFIAFHPSSLILLTSLTWFVVATFVIIPHFGAAKYGSGDSIYFQRFGELGATPAAVVRTLVTNPLLVFRILSEPARLAYLGGLLASVGFLAVLAPEVLLIGAPLLMANLLSNFPAQYSGDFHYSAPLAPIFLAAAVYGLRRLRSLAPAWLSGILIAGVLASVLLFHRVRGYSPLSENFYWPDITAHNQRFDRIAAQIPRDARLSATPPLFPHLSHREFIYVFPVVADADYVLLDAAGVTDMHPNDFRNAVNMLLAGGQFGVLSSADGYILLKRGAAGGDLSDSYYDFVRAPDARPQVLVDVVFGDAVRLLGYDLLPDPRWHTVRVRYYWQALRPLEDDIRLYPFYHDASGKIIEDSIQRPLVATTWYPPPRWRVGEIIQTETLPWDVGDSFLLAAGVMHGNDFDRKGRRLATTAGDTQVELGGFEWRGKTLVRR